MTAAKPVAVIPRYQRVPPPDRTAQVLLLLPRLDLGGLLRALPPITGTPAHQGYADLMRWGAIASVLDQAVTCTHTADDVDAVIGAWLLRMGVVFGAPTTTGWWISTGRPTARITPPSKVQVL